AMAKIAENKELKPGVRIERDYYYGDYNDPSNLRRAIFIQQDKHIDDAITDTLRVQLNDYQSLREQASEAGESRVPELLAVDQLMSVPKTVLEVRREAVVKRMHGRITEPTADATLRKDIYDTIEGWVRKIN